MDEVGFPQGQLPVSLARRIIDHTAVPFVLIDPGGTVVFASASLPVVVGWSPEQVVGRNMIDFVDPNEIDLPLAALAEVNTIDRMGASVPIVLRIRVPEGWRHVEIAAMPLFDGEDGDFIALRLRSWEGERHMSDFVRAMLRGGSIEVDIEALSKSLTATLEGVGAAVHHGFDGTSFVGVAGSWPGARDLPLDGSPWVDALESDDVLVVSAPERLRAELGAAVGWMVPVRPASGIAPAVLSVWRDKVDGPFIGHRRGFVQASDFVELALVRSSEHEHLLHLARHDPLTGVANRTTFRDVLAAALARGEEDLAVGFCDLDGFKRVNDRHGHGVGDEVLVAMAGRLRNSLRDGDELARLGGDEFTVLWRRIPDVEAAENAAARVVEAGDATFGVQRREVSVGVSVGVALARPGSTAEGLLAAADAALYEAKEAGGRRAVVRIGAPPPRS